jgi:hypothetical protein
MPYNFNSFVEDCRIYEVLDNWKNERYPDETLIVFLRYIDGRTARNEWKFTTMQWSINKQGSFKYGEGSHSNNVQSVTLYDWETKEKIGVYSPNEFKNLW